MYFWINCDLTFSNKGTHCWYIYVYNIYIYIYIVYHLLYMAEMIPVLEVTPMVPSLNGAGANSLENCL